jgi:23S rRNA pseudouridine1911/1915/1917 synthase
VRTVAPASCSILETLRLLVPGASGRTLRQMLSLERVTVNGCLCKIANAQINAGDVIEIGPRKLLSKLPPGLEILFEDSDILVIQKPSGMLTVATIDERERTVYAYLKQRLKEGDPRQKLFIVHRLDKFASGVLVFARSEKVKSALQKLFMKHDIQRKYWAIVEGKVERNEGTIRSHIAEDKSLRMHSTNDAKHGKAAVTHYKVLRRFPGLSALEVTLETGRKNQIRVHLSEMGHPIAGDRAYGSVQDPLGRLGLHAFCLGFKHPTKKIPLLFQTEPPPEFRRYIKPEATGNSSVGRFARKR